MAGTSSNLTKTTASFSDMMLNNGFGIVTVMNAEIFDYNPEFIKKGLAKDIIKAYQTQKDVAPIKLDTLKIANVTIEGPSKTVTGGRYSNPLIKFGKSARLEIQDALGNAKAIEALCSGLNEYNEVGHTSLYALHYGEDFSSDKTIIGDTFFIDRKTGKQVPVTIIFYCFNPDSIFNLTQDAEGDATVFDMNGDLGTVEIAIGDKEGTGTVTHGVFYSIVEKTDATTPSSYLRAFAKAADLNAHSKEVYEGQKVLVGTKTPTVCTVTKIESGAVTTVPTAPIE